MFLVGEDDEQVTASRGTGILVIHLETRAQLFKTPLAERCR